MEGRIDGVMVENVRTGRTELRHRLCTGPGEFITGDAGTPLQPNRNDYDTEEGYEAAIDAMDKCTLCGKSITLAG